MQKHVPFNNHRKKQNINEVKKKFNITVELYLRRELLY
jgi:hypothetical protein